MITLEKLKEMRACPLAIDWFVSKDTTDLMTLYEMAKEENHLDWAIWYIVRIMNRQQQIQFAIFDAELVLDVFEKHK